MIASEGYLHVPQCIEDKDLHALRAEADSLFNLKRSKSALSEDEYFDKVRTRCFQFRHPIYVLVCWCCCSFCQHTCHQSRSTLYLVA